MFQQVPRHASQQASHDVILRHHDYVSDDVQVEADTGEAPEDDATARPQMEKDNLAARLLFVCTTVLNKHVQVC